MTQAYDLTRITAAWYCPACRSLTQSEEPARAGEQLPRLNVYKHDCDGKPRKLSGAELSQVKRRPEGWTEAAAERTR